MACRFFLAFNPPIVYEDDPRMKFLMQIKVFVGETGMNRFKAAVLLLTTTFFWGVTFTVVKQAIESVSTSSCSCPSASSWPLC